MENPIAYVVLKPGIDPLTVEKTEVEPIVVTLDWRFADKTNEEMIDQIPEIDARIKALAKWIESAKGVLKSRLTAPQNVGDVSITRAATYEAVFSKRARVGLDQEKVKEEMGEAWYAEHCKTTEYEELRFKALASSL